MLVGYVCVHTCMHGTDRDTHVAIRRADSRMAYERMKLINWWHRHMQWFQVIKFYIFLQRFRNQPVEMDQTGTYTYE